MNHRTVAAPAAGLLLLLATACSTPGASVNTTPANNDTPAAAKAAATTAPAKPATVGQAINITGTKAGDALSVTLVQVVDPATGSDDFDQPDAGDVYVGVQFKITNTGTNAYSDDPDLDAVLIDAKGQQYQPAFANIKEGPGLNSSLDLVPGGTTLGFETFQVAKGTVIAQVQYQVNAGFTGQSAQWNVTS